MKVLKFGGSSLADSKQFKKVKDIVLADDDRKYVVVSAPGKGEKNKHKVTDLLLMCQQLASHGLNIDEVFINIRKTFKSIVDDLNLDIDIESILNEISHNIQTGSSVDYAVSRGEYLNARLMADYLGWSFVDAKDLIFFKDGNLDDEKTEEMIGNTLKDLEHSVIPGFYGSNEKGEIQTFSRGGSDVTGSLVANGLVADMYENWTDVSGFLMVDPRIVSDAKTIDYVTYKELRELSYMGAPVLHQDAIRPVKKYNIPINIRNTNEPENPGTTILEDYNDNRTRFDITGIAGRKNFTVITAEKTFMNSDLGVFRRIASVFETNEIPIEHIPSSIDSVSVVVETSRLSDKLSKIIEEIKIYTNPDEITVEDKISQIAIVGKGMIERVGISSRILTAVAKAGVNIKMINQGSSELNVIIGVEDKDFERAIRAIYEEFM